MHFGFSCIQIGHEGNFSSSLVLTSTFKEKTSFLLSWSTVSAALGKVTEHSLWDRVGFLEKFLGESMDKHPQAVHQLFVLLSLASFDPVGTLIAEKVWESSLCLQGLQVALSKVEQMSTRLADINMSTKPGSERGDGESVWFETLAKIRDPPCLNVRPGWWTCMGACRKGLSASRNSQVLKCR